jgi:hypothetical protein
MTVYTGLFKLVAGITVGWLLLLLFARNLVFGLLGDWSAFVVNTSLMGALAILSGPLLLHHFRSFPYEDRERGEWTGMELFYAIVFCLTVFIFAISVASLLLSG